MPSRENELISAYVWAACRGGVSLLSLEKGDSFLWSHTEDKAIKIYCGRGWYRLGGRKFRASTKSAVRKVNSKEREVENGQQM